MNPTKAERTESSLLIPEKLIDVYEEKTNNISREKYLHVLLRKYGDMVLIGLLAKSQKIKTSYQEEHQNLIKKNFRPFNDDWIELGILANYLGISRTALFTWFLMLELGEWDIILSERFYDSGVPPKLDFLQLKICLTSKIIIRADRKILYKIRR